MSNALAVDMYGGVSPNDYPLYAVRDASRFLKMASATLRSWFVGTNRGEFQPVLEPAGLAPLKLSFNNLAEAFVLRSLRREYDVKLPRIRAAISEAEAELGIDRLLLRSDLKAHAGALLIEKFGHYLTLGASGQYAMKQMLIAALDRFVWEDPNFPSVLYPYLPEAAQSLGDKIIVINPKRSFGSPYLTNRGVTTAVIAMRFDAGESIRDLAQDYQVEEKEIGAAIIYEEAA